MSPIVTVAIIGLCLVLVFFGLSLWVWYFHSRQGSFRYFMIEKGELITTLRYTLGTWAVVSFIIFAMFVEHIPPGALLIDKESNTILAYYPSRFFAWRISVLGFGRTIAPNRETWMTEVTVMHIEPITANPKVRRLTYRLEYQIVDQQKFDAEFLGVNRWYAVSFASAVKFHLFEFQERHSRELAAFYNPEDPQQQSRFARLIRDDVDPHLADYGLRIKDARFNLP